MALPTLISNHVGTNPIIISERNSQKSHLTMWEPIPQPYQKGPALTSDHERNQSSIHVSKALHLHSTHVRNQSNIHVKKDSALIFDTYEEPIQHACSKRLYTYIRHMRGTNPTCMFERALHLHLIHARNQSNMHVRKGSALTSDTCEEPIPQSH